jgi:hypothetical protein
MAAAEVRAAKAAKAKVVNCIVVVLAGWFGEKSECCLGAVDGLIDWMDG